jgi:hypothetical protein
MSAVARLRAILFAHECFLAGDPKGVCVDLRGANLTRVDLKKRDLRSANFARANFEGADLRNADLTGANLCAANLHTAKVKGANFTAAVLTRAFAAFVDFTDCNLDGADFYGADLAGAKWGSADWGKSWEGQLQAAKFRIVPEGDVIGWKKLRGGQIAKLLIPKEARRSNGFNRRCRAEYARVLSIVDGSGALIAEGTSRRDADLKYAAGEIVRPDGYDEDWKNECSYGINFFTTFEEAEAY